eukprot:3167687-Rhodomonas_salina.2
MPLHELAVGVVGPVWAEPLDDLRVARRHNDLGQALLAHETGHPAACNASTPRETSANLGCRVRCS